MFEVGKTYPDKRGWQVEVIYDMGSGAFPIIGIARNGEKAVLMSYTEEGFQLAKTSPNNFDLIQPEKSVYVVEWETDGEPWNVYIEKKNALHHSKNDETKKVYRYVRKEQIK